MLGSLCFKKKKFYVLLTAIDYFPVCLDFTKHRNILEPSSHFSLLLFCLNFTGNRRKHAGAGSAISAVSMYSLSYSGARTARFGLYSEVTI